VPGLPTDVEPVLRRALSKQPAERFPSMRDFARAFEAAAFGRSADATPAPVLVSAVSPSNATIGFSETRFQGAPAFQPAVPKPQVVPMLEVVERGPVARVARSARKPESDTLLPTDDPVRVPLLNRIKLVYAIVAAVGVLVLLLVTLLLVRAGSAHKPPAASLVPSVVPSLPPSPASGIAMPEPTEAKPAGVVPEPQSGKRSKRSDGVSSPKKAIPMGDPFESSPRPKSKAKKKLYEDL